VYDEKEELALIKKLKQDDESDDNLNDETAPVVIKEVITKAEEDR